MKKTFAFIALLLMLDFYSQAQSLAINTDGSAADVSALLDVKSTSKGLLLPRMTLTQKNVVSLPATGLLVYQTDGTKGLYVNNGTPAVPNWQLVTASSNAWGLTGNTGTIDGTNFIGTTDNIPFTIKVNNQKAGRIDQLAGNNFFGYQTGNNTNTGVGNTAYGHTNLYSNTGGNNNTSMGRQAMYFNTTGNSNTALGYATAINNTVGNNNTASGFYALYNNVAGSNGLAVGYQAMLYANSSSTPFTNYNMAVGYEALRGSTIPTNNTGNYNTALGYQALWSNTTGSHNNAIGYLALNSNTIGELNTAIGDSALSNNTAGNRNIAIGFNALNSSDAWENIAIGTYALFKNTSGNYNVATGAGALAYSTTGYSNNAYGFASLEYNNTGIENAAFGSYSLNQNDYGIYNTAIGNHALELNISGSNNSANGYNSLYANTVGVGNTALGSSSLLNNTFGNYNTAIGCTAGPAVSVGFNNSTSIGYNAAAPASNTMQFGNNAITDVYAGVGTAATIHAGYAAIEKSVRVDNASSNNGTYQNSLQFGSAGTGETIGSNRTAGANLWGLDFYTSFANRLCISNGGNIGISTTSPTSKLDVNGQITIDQKNFGGYGGLLIKGNTAVSNYPNIAFSTQNTSASDVISAAIGGNITNNAAGSEAIDLGFYTSTSGLGGLTQRMVIKDNGYVGIGETSPAVPLNFASTLGNKISFWGTGATHYGMGIQGFLMQLYTQDINGNIAFGYGSSGAFTETMRIKGNGNVGIGTSSPTAMLSVNGTANNSTGNWTVFSDERIKTITDDFTDGLTVIKKIQPVKFRYNDNAPFKSDEEQIGIVAQDLEKIAPYMVSQKPYKEFNDLREVNNQAYVFLLINAVKEQQVQIEAQQKENNGQKQRIDDLEKIVKELSRKVNQ